MDHVREPRADAPLNRRPYRKPTLRSFGDMRRLTEGPKNGAKGDGPDNPGGPATRVVS